MENNSVQPVLDELISSCKALKPGGVQPFCSLGCHFPMTLDMRSGAASFTNVN
jgi:hypothetical protein